MFFNEGFDVHLTHDTENPHRMSMTMPDGTIKLIPMEYDVDSRSWVARMCVSKFPGRAEKQVRRILARIDRGQEWRFFHGNYLTPVGKAQILRQVRGEELEHALAEAQPRQNEGMMRAVTRQQRAADEAASS